MSASIMSSAKADWRVLVADDQPSVIEALMLLFKSQGIAADQANTPEEVAKLIAGRSYDLLLMDMNYARDTTSGAEGLELLAAVRSADPALAVVVMTAWSTVDIAVAALQRGANDFIQKPWDNLAALKIIEKQMNVTRVRRSENAIRAAEIGDASLVQRTLMGASLGQFGPFTIAANTRSHREVGGDYFDVLENEHGKVALCVADVMGKGVGAALLMANMQAHYRNITERGLPPAALLDSLNATMLKASAHGKFITMFAASLDVNARILQYSNAGHPAGILVRADGRSELLSTADAILGSISTWTYKQQSCILETGDRVVLLSDGFLEAANCDSEEIGEERLQNWCVELRTLPAPEMLGKLTQRLLDFCESQLTDDATIMVIAAD